MTALLSNFPPARECEAERADLGGPRGEVGKSIGCDETRDLPLRVSQAVADLNQVQHEQLTQRLEDVIAVLNQEIGKTRLNERTKRHLYSSTSPMDLNAGIEKKRERVLISRFRPLTLPFTTQLPGFTGSSKSSIT